MFRGNLRHYHRKTSAQSAASGMGGFGPAQVRRWAKILLIVLAITALAGILVGLYDAMR